MATSRRLLALLLPTILAGCASSSAVAPASPNAQLSRECETLAKESEHPQLSLRTNPKLAVGEYAVALNTANDNLGATRECQRLQRERLAGGE